MTKAQATAAATALVKRLKGRGWERSVVYALLPTGENGYCYGATMVLASGKRAGDYTIHVYPRTYGGRTQYTCVIGQGCLGYNAWTGDADRRSSVSPNKAVAKAMKLWRAYVEGQAALVAEAHKRGL